MPLSNSVFEALLSRLEGSAGKTMSEVQKRRLCEILTPLSTIKASSIVHDIERMENLPKNIVAVVMNAIDRYSEADNSKTMNSSSWQAKELCTTPDDFEMFFRISTLLMKAMQEGKIEYNPESDSLRDLEAWVAAGRPKTWCELHDEFLKGFEVVYKNEKLCTSYLQRFYETIKQLLLKKPVQAFEEKNK